MIVVVRFNQNECKVKHSVPNIEYLFPQNNITKRKISFLFPSDSQKYSIFAHSYSFFIQIVYTKCRGGSCTRPEQNNGNTEYAGGYTTRPYITEEWLRNMAGDRKGRPYIKSQRSK